MSTTFRLFIQCGLGLEGFVAAELAERGLANRSMEGGVETRCDLSQLYRLSFGLRVAESIRVRLKEFQAREFTSLTRELGKLPFRAFLAPGTSVRVQVVCHKSKLWHSGAVQQRCEELLVDRVGLSIEKGESAQVVFVRLDDDQVQVSLEAAGRMHQRGYRTHVERASLRETLASALVASAVPLRQNWDEEVVLWDPFCGAGTVGLEALHWAQGKLAGETRKDALEGWRNFDPALFEQAREGELRRQGAPAPRLRVLLSDHKEKALEAARANAKNAQLLERCEFLLGTPEDLSDKVPHGACVVTNPPYGKRIEEAGAMKSLLTVLQARPDLTPAVALVGGAARDATPADRAALFRTKNGGVAVSARRLAKPRAGAAIASGSS